MGFSSTALNQPEVESLLSDLCVGYGFCLPSEEDDRLLANPPRTYLLLSTQFSLRKGSTLKPPIGIRIEQCVTALRRPLLAQWRNRNLIAR
jgi:hypothetical protein